MHEMAALGTIAHPVKAVADCHSFSLGFRRQSHAEFLWKETRKELRAMTKDIGMKLINASTGEDDHNVAIVELWKLGIHR